MSNRKAKWRNISITEENVDQYLQDLYDDTKGQYINQGVSFNKDDPYQMGLLKLALLEPQAFSGLCKQLLAHYFKNKSVVAQEMGIVNIPPVQIKTSVGINDNLDKTEEIPQPMNNPAPPPVHKSDQPNEQPSRPPLSRKPRGGSGKLSGLME